MKQWQNNSQSGSSALWVCVFLHVILLSLRAVRCVTPQKPDTVS